MKTWGERRQRDVDKIGDVQIVSPHGKATERPIGDEDADTRPLWERMADLLSASPAMQDDARVRGSKHGIRQRLANIATLVEELGDVVDTATTYDVRALTDALTHTERGLEIAVERTAREAGLVEG